MLTLLPGERKAKISFTQRSCPSAGTRQTSIASFLTLQPGMVSTVKAIRVQKGGHSFFQAATFMRSGVTSALC